MPQQIRGKQIQDQTITRDDLELDFSDPNALRGQDIPYSDAFSVKSKIDNMGGGEAEIVDFASDDTYPVTNTTLWTLAKAINFPTDANGIAYFNFFTLIWDFSTDISITIGYAMSTSLGASNVKLDLEYWVVGDGVTPDPGSPTGTDTQTFVPTATGNQYKQFLSTLALANAHVSAAKQLVLCKLKRDVSVASNHTGAFQLVKLLMHQ